MSGRPPSDPRSADAKPAAERVAARTTDSEIDAAFEAATSQMPAPARAQPRRQAATLVGIAPPVLPAVPPAPLETAPPVKRVMTESEESPSPDSDAAPTVRRELPNDLRPTPISEKPAQPAEERPKHRSFRARRPPSFGRVLRLKVRTLGIEAPLWFVVALLIMPFALAAGLAGSELIKARRQPRAVVASAPSAEPVSSGAGAPVASAAPSASAVSQLELTELEAQPAGSLTSEQVLARAGARLEREISVAKGLRQNIEREPDVIKQKGMLLALRKLTANPTTAPEALAGMASLPGPTGPDLLYEIWVSRQSRPEVAELARELLYSSDVRPKASEALGANLDLRASTHCDETKAAMAKVLEVGDRRSLPALSKLMSKRGCGPSKRDDCYPCLGDRAEIKAGAGAVKKRRAPTPFSVP